MPENSVGSPRGPPSLTRIWSSSQIERLPSLMALGVSASIEVLMLQVEPIAGSEVAVQGSEKRLGSLKFGRVPVAGSSPLAPLWRSVICASRKAGTWPV